MLGLYKGTSEARKLVLKDKLKNIKMTKSKSVISYLIRFTQVKDKSAKVGETFSNKDLVSFELLGFLKLWGNLLMLLVVEKTY